MNIARINKALTQLTETATESMQTPSTGMTGEARDRWVAERNFRLGLLVKLYCAEQVSSEVSSLETAVRSLAPT